MKKISSTSRSAIGTTIVVAIVIVIIVVAAVGAYAYEASLKPGSSTSSSTSSSTTSTTTSSTTPTTTTSSTGGTTTTTTTSASMSYPSSLPSLTVLEAGSSLVYPLMNLWSPAFKQMYSSVQLTTAAGGSGSGQSGAEQGHLQLGASDAYLTNAQHSTYPYILNIPLAISAQQVNYNIPGLPATMHLNFSGPVLAGIYNGTIKYWDDPAIKNINPGANQYLTHNAIIPIHRSDASGDTFIFSQYLSFSTPSWNSSVGFGTSVNWPSVPGALAENGNSAMVTTCQQNQYSIAYIGISYLATAINPTSGPALGYAHLQNKAGNFVNISISNIQAAASALVPSTPADERISLIYAPGAYSYPIINYEYVMVAQNQTAPGMALTLRTMLTWMIDPAHGNSPQFLSQVSFIPLPASTVTLTLAQIAKITGP